MAVIYLCEVSYKNCKKYLKGLIYGVSSALMLVLPNIFDSDNDGQLCGGFIFHVLVPQSRH